MRHCIKTGKKGMIFFSSMVVSDSLRLLNLKATYFLINLGFNLRRYANFPVEGISINKYQIALSQNHQYIAIKTLINQVTCVISKKILSRLATQIQTMQNQHFQIQSFCFNFVIDFNFIFELIETGNSQDHFAQNIGYDETGERQYQIPLCNIEFIKFAQCLSSRCFVCEGVQEHCVSNYVRRGVTLSGIVEIAQHGVDYDVDEQHEYGEWQVGEQVHLPDDVGLLGPVEHQSARRSEHEDAQTSDDSYQSYQQVINNTIDDIHYSFFIIISRSLPSRKLLCAPVIYFQHCSNLLKRLFIGCQYSFHKVSSDEQFSFKDLFGNLFRSNIFRRGLRYYFKENCRELLSEIV